MWKWNCQIWEKNKETLKCDKSIVKCDIETAQCDDETVKYEKIIIIKEPLNMTKVSDGYIRDLGFNPRLHQKLIGVLV